MTPSALLIQIIRLDVDETPNRFPRPNLVLNGHPDVEVELIVKFLSAQVERYGCDSLCDGGAPDAELPRHPVELRISGEVPCHLDRHVEHGEIGIAHIELLHQDCSREPDPTPSPKQAAFQARPLDANALDGRNQLLLNLEADAFAIARWRAGAWRDAVGPIGFEPTHYRPKEFRA